MTRSKYIWVVQRPQTRTLVAAFTVKHELASWLKRHPKRQNAGLTFIRVRDGQDNPDATEVSQGELLCMAGSGTEQD
jgi:hypothetical protein